MRKRVILQVRVRGHGRSLCPVTKKSSVPGATLEWGLSEDDEAAFRAFFFELAAYGRLVDAPLGF